MTRDSRGYYYRCERTAAGPRNRYVGSGPVADATEQLDQAFTQQRAELRRRMRDLRQTERERDAQVDADYMTLRTFVRGALVAAGWYSHNREWRRYTLRIGVEDMAELTRTELESLTAAELDALVERCNKTKPNPADIDALRTVVMSPVGAHVAAVSGLTLARELFNSTGAAKVVIDAELKRLRRDLGGDDALPIEQALIDHIVTCWARLSSAERGLTKTTTGDHSRDSALYWERRVDAAQRRYLRALGLLARMRALTRVQVNIAEVQQVNN